MARTKRQHPLHMQTLAFFAILLIISPVVTEINTNFINLHIPPAHNGSTNV